MKTLKNFSKRDRKEITEQIRFALRVGFTPEQLSKDFGISAGSIIRMRSYLRIRYPEIVNEKTPYQPTEEFEKVAFLGNYSFPERLRFATETLARSWKPEPSNQVTIGQIKKQ